MTPATAIFLRVVAAQTKGIVEAQRRIVVAFEKWLEMQGEERAASTYTDSTHHARCGQTGDC